MILRKCTMFPVLALAGVASAQVQIRNDIAGTFIDISSTGNVLDLADDGEENVFTSLLGTLRIGNNGAVGLTDSGDAFAGNSELPTASLFGGANAHAVYWDDLDTETGSVTWQEFGDRVIVQWTDRPYFSGSANSDGVTFQIQLFAGGNVLAQYLYQDVLSATHSDRDNGAGATIGYQYSDNDDLFFAAQWSHNEASVFNGDVLTVIVPTPGTGALLGLGALAACRRRR